MLSIRQILHTIHPISRHHIIITALYKLLRNEPHPVTERDTVFVPRLFVYE